MALKANSALYSVTHFVLQEIAKFLLLNCQLIHVFSFERLSMKSKLELFWMDFRLRSTKNNVNWSSNSNFTLQKRIFFECIVNFHSQNFSQSGLKLPKQIRFKLYCLLCPNERAWLPISQHRKARTHARQFSAQCTRQPAHSLLDCLAWCWLSRQQFCPTAHRFLYSTARWHCLDHHKTECALEWAMFWMCPETSIIQTGRSYAITPFSM